MALDISVTAKSVDIQFPKCYNVVLNLTCTDTGTSEEVINQDFTEKYETGETLGDLYSKFIDTMQTAIDDYNDEQTLINSVSMVNLLAVLNSNLTE